jgi:hypothetical protein
MADSKATTGTAIDGGLIRRQPLIAYFVIAYAVTWFVEGLFVLSRDGSGLLAFKAPMGFAMATGIATSLGPASAAFIVRALPKAEKASTGCSAASCSGASASSGFCSSLWAFR